jgi:hypothetical protein
MEQEIRESKLCFHSSPSVLLIPPALPYGTPKQPEIRPKA